MYVCVYVHVYSVLLNVCLEWRCQRCCEERSSQSLLPDLLRLSSSQSVWVCVGRTENKEFSSANRYPSLYTWCEISSRLGVVVYNELCLGTNLHLSTNPLTCTYIHVQYAQTLSTNPLTCTYIQYVYSMLRLSVQIPSLAECLEILGVMVQENGTAVCQPSPPKAVQQISMFIGEKDSTVRNAALNTLVVFYGHMGETLYKHVGKVRLCVCIVRNIMSIICVMYVCAVRTYVLTYVHTYVCVKYGYVFIFDIYVYTYIRIYCTSIHQYARMHVCACTYIPCVVICL